MSKNKIITFIFCFLIMAQPISTAAHIKKLASGSQVVTKRKIAPPLPVKTDSRTNTTTNSTQQKKQISTTSKKMILPVESWKNLYTTKIPGIYKKDADNSVYFYNTKEQQMVKVPINNKTDYLSTKDLGESEEEFKSHGNKTNMFRHDGKIYIIMEPQNAKNAANSLPIKDWSSLRTTNIPGVYMRQEIGCGPCGSMLVTYYYYNKKTKQMVKIQKTYSPAKRYAYNQKTKQLYIINDTPLTSTKDLGNLENEFKIYGNKSNTFSHNGKIYTIPKN